MNTKPNIEQLTTDLSQVLLSIEKTKELVSKFIGAYFENKDVVIGEREEEIKRIDFTQAYLMLCKVRKSCRFKDPNLFLQVKE